MMTMRRFSQCWEVWTNTKDGHVKEWVGNDDVRVDADQVEVVRQWRQGVTEIRLRSGLEFFVRGTVDEVMIALWPEGGYR